MPWPVVSWFVMQSSAGGIRLKSLDSRLRGNDGRRVRPRLWLRFAFARHSREGGNPV